MKLKFFIWLMGWSGQLSAWAWRKQANMIKYKQREKTLHEVLMEGFEKEQREREEDDG